MAKKMQDKKILKIAAFLMSLSEEDARRLGFLRSSQKYVNVHTFKFTFGEKNPRRNGVASKSTLKKIINHNPDLGSKLSELYTTDIIPALHTLFSQSKAYVKEFKSFNPDPIIDLIRRAKFLEQIFHRYCLKAPDYFVEEYLSVKLESLLNHPYAASTNIVNDVDYAQLDLVKFDVTDLDSCVEIYTAECFNIMKAVREMLNDPSDFTEVLMSGPTSRANHIKNEIFGYHEDDEDIDAVVQQFAAVVEPKYLPLLLLDKKPIVREFAKIFIQYNEKKRVHI